MNGHSHRITPAACLALSLLAVVQMACNDPTKPNFDPLEVGEEEICEASADWLPNTPEVPQFLPVPHPAGECPFYRSASIRIPSTSTAA